MTKKKLLQWFTGEARRKGIKVSGGVNGGGWIKLAKAHGDHVTCNTRKEARRLLQVWHGLPPLAPRFTQKTPRKSFAQSDSFLESYEWRRVRMVVLKKYGSRCQCCGATPSDGVRIHVDHIKPRKKYPELALDENNLQVLCEVCNHGKGNWDQTDWRSEAAANDSLEAQHIRSIASEGTWPRKKDGKG